ncbi:mevalonate kinase [Legionella sp. km772]|uniref:mevalonate kinase family protein n=1 Tax=Legionella sp. km772 TaxID=2498111 RepID=UPI000F8D8AB2|nr:hypothetical protein [Legionella sp. km772]RUR11600.1 hypothetical protein ELY15_06970 [Legionella sp. km772]
MKWTIPAKTFLLGEYAALEGASALLAATSPCFELTIAQQPTAAIHPESPAGRWWDKQHLNNYALFFKDPYQGCGGLGASSAQFIGAYLASTYLKQEQPSLKAMLEAYYECAWNGQGARPSGYDVIAQTQYGCVFVNKDKIQIHSYAWNFNDLSFQLIHTGIKLATHHHLQEINLNIPTDELSAIVDKAKHAFEQNNSLLFIESINAYHHELNRLNLVAHHSLELIEEFRSYPEVLAVKGCGALGADIILIICLKNQVASLKMKLLRLNKKILASEINLTQKSNKLLNN